MQTEIKIGRGLSVQLSLQAAHLLLTLWLTLPFGPRSLGGMVIEEWSVLWWEKLKSGSVLQLSRFPTHCSWMIHLFWSTPFSVIEIFSKVTRRRPWQVMWNRFDNDAMVELTHATPFRPTPFSFTQIISKVTQRHPWPKRIILASITLNVGSIRHLWNVWIYTWVTSWATLFSFTQSMHERIVAILTACHEW